MRRRVIVLIAAFVAYLAAADNCFAADACSENQDKDYLSTTAKVDDFNIGHIGESRVIKLKTDGSLQTLDFDENNRFERYFRVRIRHDHTTPKSWRLTLYDSEGFHPVQTIGPKELGGARSIWSRRIDGAEARATLEVLSGDKAEFLRIDGAIIVEQTPKISYYSVENKAKPKWSCLLCARTPEQKKICDEGLNSCDGTHPKTRRWGESVGMLMLRGEKDVWTCSGFLLSPDLFLTNWHCGGTKNEQPQSFWGSDLLETIILDFSWDGDDLSNEYGVDPIDENCPVAKDKDLDYAIFRVKPHLQSFGPPPYVRLKRNSEINHGDKLTLIHHPRGQLKHLTQEECVVDSPDYPSWFDRKAGVDFTHRCDSEGGSSGAPLFDGDGFVVGVHHAGYGVDEQGKCDQRNKAVKIEKILDHLPEPLRQEILDWQE